MSKHDFDQYKNSPIGSPGRMVYDRYNLSTKNYFDRYYSNPDLSNWNMLVKDIIDPLFDISRRKSVLSNISVYGKNFSIEEMEAFYNEHKSRNVFDDDIFKFMAFLNGQGFFKRIKMSYDQWINAKNYANPHRPESDYPDTVSLVDNTKFEHGMNAVRMELTSIDFDKIR